MTKYSKNAKLNAVLNAIEANLLDLGIDELKRYYNEFRGIPDYNIAQYGNLIIYYDNVRDLYKNCGYKSVSKYSNTKIWETYRRQVGYITRKLIYKNL